MNNSLICWLIFILSSYILIVADYLDFSPNVVARVLVLSVTLLLLFINILRPTMLKNILASWSRWVLLFIINIIIQFVVITTGGLYSPFLILIHLSTIGISLLFRFSTASIFLCFSFANIVVNILLNPIVSERIANDPAVLFIIATSFIAIVPISKLISDRYHLQGVLLQTLHNQIQLEEALLADVEELIFITDIHLNILSINDAVERTLRRPQGELLNKSIFDVLFLKDKEGRLISSDTLGIPELVHTSSPRVISQLSLLATVESMRKVNLQIRPISGPGGTVDQLSFVITSTKGLQTTEEQHLNVENARIKHEAMIEDLKRRLIVQGQYDAFSRLLFIAGSEKDILTYRTIEDHGITQHKVLVDVALICRQTIEQEQDFANVLKVPLTFTLVDFKDKDIRSSLLEILHIAADQPTGPFFTTLTDVKYLELLIQKLLEVALLLASGQQNSQTQLSIRQDISSITISIATSCPSALLHYKEAIFEKYYGVLSDKTNLRLGSGLEGFIAKTIADALDIHVEVLVNSSSSFFSSSCIFTFQLSKQIRTKLPFYPAHLKN